MNERHRSPARAPVRGAISVSLVLVLASLLFAANARLAGGVDAREPQDLAHLVEAEMERSAALAEEVQALSAEVDALTDGASTGMPAEDVEAVSRLALEAGRVPVAGPGLTVTLNDASPNAPRPDWVTNDMLVVHQQDIQAVINALWEGGAEAMTLQGERVVATSAFRCVGNVLLLHDQVFSPPYAVQVIGDPDVLRSALRESEAIANYLEYVDAVGLGWSVQDHETIELPAYEDTLQLEHAGVPEGTPVLPSGVTT